MALDGSYRTPLRRRGVAHGAYPITVGGRVFTFVILMIGLGIVSVSAGLVASALSKARAEDQALSEDKIET